MFWQKLSEHPRSILWVALAYLPCLWCFSVPLTGDQKVYIATAMEMREQGSWLTPYLFGDPSYFKPPLHFWSTLLSWKVWGFSILGTLLPSVLCLVVTAFLLGEISAKLGQPKKKAHAGLLFAGTAGALTYGTTAQMEMYIVLFYVLGWYLGLSWLRKNKRRYLYTAFLVAGLASLVKSPLYSVFWVLGFGLYLVLENKLKSFREKHLYLALAVGITAGLAWFIAAYVMDGETFWRQYILGENYHKRGGNLSSPFRMWLDFLTFFAPFLLLALLSLRTLGEPRIFRFSLAFAGLPAVFFTGFPYRTETYLFILVPMVCIWIDHWMAGRWSNIDCWIARLNGVVVALVGLLVATIFIRTELVTSWIAIPLGGAGLVVAVTLWGGLRFASVLAFILVITLFRLAAIDLGETDIAGLRNYPPNERGLVYYDPHRSHWNEVGLHSLVRKRPMGRAWTPEQFRQNLRAGKSIVVSEEHVDQVLTKEQLTRLSVYRWKRLQRRMQLPFRDLLLSRKRFDIEARMYRVFFIIKRAV